MSAERQVAVRESARRANREWTPITIVLADDQHLVRGGIRCLIDREPDFKVIGEVADGFKVAGLVERLKPRLLIVALAMPGLNGIEITRRVRQRSPATNVIVLSMYGRDHYVIQALRSGALGYVVKQARPSELARAIRNVVAGRRYLSRPLSRRPLGVWLQRAKNAEPEADETLTPREREVLQLVTEGFSNARIAHRLSISRRTAEAHRANAMRKLQVRNAAHLTRYLLARSIPSPVS